MRNNQNFKKLKTALLLSRADVVEIMRFGGLEVSKSRADGWGRGATAEKWSGTGEGQKRMVPMKDEEFDAFCSGLIGWMIRDDDKGRA